MIPTTGRREQRRRRLQWGVLMGMACDQSAEVEDSANHVIRIPLPQEPPIACVHVEPGDTVILPFDVSNADISSDMMIRAQVLDGDLVIEQEDGATIILQGFVQAEVTGGQEVEVLGTGGNLIAVALWLAETDPNIVVSH
jgi:hypothetical protein